MKTFYGLKATGAYQCFGDKLVAHSRRIFETEKEANVFIPIYKQSIIDKTKGKLHEVDPSSLIVEVIDYQLE